MTGVQTCALPIFYPLDLIATSSAASEIVANLSATPRESTNLIDVYFLAPDPIVVPRVLNVAAAHDSGTIVNPIGAEGQVEGGVVMGIGQALLEGNQIADDGRMLGAGLLDYKLQTMSDIPPISIRFVGPPAENAGPMGAKTIAEPPSVPTLAAIGNAIHGATGAAMHELPMTPNRV